MIKLQQTIQLLARSGVEFVIVGGVAVSLHGSSYVTFDLDLCYARTRLNLHHIIATLAPYQPRLRDLPEGLPFVWDEQTLQHGTNFTLATDLGDIDLLGEITGIGAYQEVRAVSIMLPLYGVACQVLTLDALITAKRAAGRPKDLLVLPELEALREVSQKPDH